MNPTHAALQAAVTFAAVLLVVSVGFAWGSDARLCASGPSPEEATMRAMHEQCKLEGGVWRWRMDRAGLTLEATCLGRWPE
jgi:hypothetical protein